MTRFLTKHILQPILLTVLLLVLAAIFLFQVLPPSTATQAADDANSRYHFKPFRGKVAIERDMQAVARFGIGPTALDGMGREQYTAFRLQKIKKYRQLGFFRPGYTPFAPPHSEIHGHMTPGADWLYSVPYYIANPYLLIILVPARHVTPLDMHVDKVNILYQNGVLHETVLGTSARQWFAAAYSSEKAGVIRLIMVNAWDAGFHCIHLDPAFSCNIKISSNEDNVTRSWHSRHCVFHMGRYGKNNLSPEDKQGWVELQERDVRTRLHVKLWRAKPAAVSDPADLLFIITIDPRGA